MPMKTSYAKSARGSRGYTLINVMLLLASMAVIATLQFRDQSFQLATQRAVIAGKQLRLVDDGIEGYVAAHANHLRGMVDNDCAGAGGCVPTAWYCSAIGTTGDQCELDLSHVALEGYLPPNWVNSNVWGAPYKAVVSRVLKVNAVTTGNEMDYNLRVVTATQSPWTDASGIPQLGLLGQAVQAGGADLAMTTDDPNTARGLVRRSYDATMANGTLLKWTADNSMNPYINAVGLLVARAGFESSANTAFAGLLRRDGSRMMQNDLDLGGNRVNNAQDAYVKNISGGRNLAALGPTWVFKYSWRIANDGATLPKPDCSVQSGGWTTPTTLVNPWDPRFNPADTTAPINKSYDSGEPRILVLNDYLANMESLGYYDAGTTCPAGILDTDPASTTSCPAADPFDAYDPAFRARAKAAYSFYAIDAGANWNVYMRYYQNTTAADPSHNNASVDATNSRGIASVYCYYDNKASSGCNGEAGCADSGVSNPAGSSTAADFTSPPSATTSDSFQSPLVSSTPSQLPPGTGLPGAADVSCNIATGTC